MNTINANGIGKKYRINHSEIPKLLADLKPVVELPYGTKTMRFWDADQVEAIIGPIMAKRRAPKAQPAPQVEQEPAPVAAPPIDLNPLVKRMVEMLNIIEDLQQDVRDLHAQNAVLLKAIEKISAAPAVGPITAILPTEPPPADPPVLRAVEAPPAPAKPRVVIVGLLNSQGSMIQKEFGSVFDLTIYSGDELRGKSKALVAKATNADRVVIMTRFVGHTAEDLVRAAGAKAIRINGALTELRDKLTELFCNPTQQAA